MKVELSVNFFTYTLRGDRGGNSELTTDNDPYSVFLSFPDLGLLLFMKSVPEQLINMKPTVNSP